MKNKKMKLGVVFILLIMLISGVLGINQSQAFSITSAELYAKGSYSNMIKYNGVEVLTTFVVYQKDGVEYPAYCLDRELPGVGEVSNYSVSVNSLVNDVVIWRAVTNGYPYKTPAELGCSTNIEAFVATKHAVYCILYGRAPESYVSMNESGTRVVNAIKQIVTNARSLSNVKPSINIEINSNNNWNIDNLNKEYVSQTITATAAIASNNCSLKLEGNFPEGTKITNLNNEEISSVVSGNNFKILIPIKNMKTSNTFTIKVESKINTKPVLYGRAPSNSLQDYALTGVSFEDAIGSKTLTYTANGTKLLIKKIEDVNKLPLEGVEFRILDANKKEIYTGLTTNMNGEIEINNLIPGKYYIEEVRTIDGYVRYDKLLEVNPELQEELTVTVVNSMSTKVEHTSIIGNVNVNQKQGEVTVISSNKNSNNNYVSNNIKIENSNQNENNNNIENNIEIKNENENINNNNLSNLIKLPKTGM